MDDQAHEQESRPSRQPVSLDIIAQHEAGHAVMRWLLGLPATKLTSSRDGGYCAGTGRPIPAHQELLLCVAGIAVESGLGLGLVDLHGSQMDDLDAARVLVSRWTPAEVDTEVQQWIGLASEMLRYNADLIEDIGIRLAESGELSARTIAARCREHRKRQRRTT